MKGKLTLYLSQYGDKFTARTIKELRQKVGPGRVSRVFVDGNGKDLGKVFHVGYSIGKVWLTAYQPLRNQI